MDPLASLAKNPTVSPLIAEATQAINAVHRRPVNLRKVDITSSEATLRGAKTNPYLYKGSELDPSISAYSVLAPGVVDETVRTFVRAPLQVLAKIDVLAGGDGRPERDVQHLQLLARVIASQPNSALTPIIVHGEILSRGFFGERSGTVARVAMRVAAIASGFDPRGLCVPETYLRRHRADYEQRVSAFADASGTGVVPFVQCQLEAFVAGAQEAEGIAALAT